MPNFGPSFKDPIFNSRGDLYDENAKFFSVSFDTKKMIHLLEKETMKVRSSGFYKALERANLRAAMAIQEGQAESVRKQIGTHSSYGRRPQRPGNRLVNSLLNEQNRRVYPNNFAVGLEAWLSKSPAAMYWRSIEEGMEGYTTDALFTDLFGASGGSIGPAASSGRFFRPNVGGPHMRMIQGARGARVHVRPIKPFHYSEGGRRAWSRFDMAQAYIDELRTAGFTNVSKSPKGGIFK